MLTQSQIRTVREALELHISPVLSLYLDVNPAKSENAGKAYLLRARAAIKAAGVPTEVSTRVLETLEQDARNASTIVIFAAEDYLERYNLHLELPLMGGVDVRWGEFYLAPLLLTIDENERYGVVYLTQDKGRMFEVFLGEIEELSGAFRNANPTEWKRMSSDSKGRRYSVGATHPRSAAATDRFENRMESWTHRFYKSMAHDLEQTMNQRAQTKLILLGTQKEVQLFESFLTKSVRSRLVAILPALSSVPANANEVLEAIRPSFERQTEQHQADLLTTLKEEGMRGLEQVLQALQEGRLRVVVAPWEDNPALLMDLEGWVGTNLAEIEPYSTSAKVFPTTLKDVLPDLAFTHGTRLEYVRGAAEAELVTQMGGLAGLARF